VLEKDDVIVIEVLCLDGTYWRLAEDFVFGIIQASEALV
jgi:hypothetical protein